MSTTDDISATEADPTLVKQLAAKLKDSLLPGDDPLTREEIDEAARFILATAAQRKPGESGAAPNPRCRLSARPFR